MQARELSVIHRFKLSQTQLRLRFFSRRGRALHRSFDPSLLQNNHFMKKRITAHLSHLSHEVLRSRLAEIYSGLLLALRDSTTF